MTFDDLMNWRAFDLIEPFGDHRADYHAASICAAVYNSMLLRVGSKKSVSPSDFVLKFTDAPTTVAPQAETAPPVADWQRMKMIAKMHFVSSKRRTTTKEQQAARRVPRPQKARR